jgi:hypothetical protein
MSYRGLAVISVLLTLISLLTILSLPLAAEQVSGAASQDLARQVADLAALVQKQQQQIETLQHSQSELLQELRATRASSNGAGAEPTAASPAASPQAVGTGTEAPSSTQPQMSQAEPVSDVRAAHYVDWQGLGRGINIGDRVRIGGYGSMRFETNDVATGNNIPGGSGSGFTFRRLVLTVDGRPASRLRVYSEVEFERLFELESEKEVSRAPGSLGLLQALEGNSGGEVSIEQAWAQYNFAENHGLRAGVVLVPVGRYNLLHDDDYWDIPRRTLTDRDAPVLPLTAAWRDLGAGLTGGFNVGRTGKLDYQIYALSGTALDYNLEHEINTTAGSPGSAEVVVNGELQLAGGFFDGSKPASAFAWRAAYSPNLHGEFAFSGYRGNYAPTFLNFHQPLTTLAYDHKWRWKGFETEAEAVYTSLGNLNTVINAFAEAAFNSANRTAPSSGEGGITSVTGELELAHLSRRRYGFWTDFKYHARPQWLKRSFLGRAFEDPQIIPIARYERVWLNGVTDNVEVSGFGSNIDVSFTQEDLEQDRVTMGLSYRPAPQFAIQAAYEHNRRLNGSHLIFPEVEQGSTNGLILGMSFAF